MSLLATDLLSVPFFSLREWVFIANPLFGNAWTGTYQFTRLLSYSNDLVNLLRNTVVINIISVVNNLVCALVLTLLLREIKWKFGAKAIQTVTFFPYFVSAIIAYAIVASLFSVNSGAINQALVRAGLIKRGINILGMPEYSWGLMIFINLWKFTGYNCILFMAAAAGIPTVNNELHFEMEGGRILGLCSGDPASEEPEQFIASTQKAEIREWTRAEDGSIEKWNAFATSDGTRYKLTPLADRFEESNIGGMTRIVHTIEGPRKEAVMTAHWQCCGEQFERLYFPRLEGNFEILLNGASIGRGNARGHACAFYASPTPGDNEIVIRLWDENHAGGVYEGAYWLRDLPAAWHHHAFNGKCLAITQRVSKEAALRAYAEGLESAMIALPRQVGKLLTAR